MTPPRSAWGPQPRQLRAEPHKLESLFGTADTRPIALPATVSRQTGKARSILAARQKSIQEIPSKAHAFLRHSTHHAVFACSSSCESTNDSRPSIPINETPQPYSTWIPFVDRRYFLLGWSRPGCLIPTGIANTKTCVILDIDQVRGREYRLEL